MPEIDIIHIELVSADDEPPAYEAATPDGSLIHVEDRDFGVESLAAIGTEWSVSRWSEPTPDDSVTLEFLDGSPRPLVLIGWAEAPIAREDVDTHSEGYDHSKRLPAVNIKVHDTDLPKGEAFKALVEEHELDSRLAGLSLDELRTLIEQYVEKHEAVFYVACEDHYDQAKDDAIENIFVGRNVKIHQEGRSGGYMVVGGLPDIEHWDVKLLTEWDMFQRSCKGLVESVPDAMVWSVLANNQDELAERVIRIEVTMVVADADFEQDAQSDRSLEADPATWDWHDMLDLTRETEIRVRKLP